jgi:hypothetical protein
LAEQALASYDSVLRWKEGLARQWGGDPLAEEPEKLEHLRRFLEHFGKDPDEAVAFCFLRRKETGERFASAKRREALVAEIRAFRDSAEETGLAARRLTSSVLSFFIHNGLLIDPAMI